jgi:hypothetical protein
LHTAEVAVQHGIKLQQVDQVLQLAAVVPQQVGQVLLAHHLFLPRKVLQVEQVMVYQVLKIGYTVIKLAAVEVLAAPGVMAQHLEIRERQEMVASVKHQQLLELYTAAAAAADVTEMEIRELVLMALE